MTKLHVRDWSSLDTLYETKCFRFINENLNSVVQFGYLKGQKVLAALGGKFVIFDKPVQFLMNNEPGITF
jgi:hypothetical protein